MNKKELMFKRAMRILDLLKKHGHVKSAYLAHELGTSIPVVQVNCKRLIDAGILASTTGGGGGYYLTDKPIKVGQVFAAMNMPHLDTGNPRVNQAFKEFLNMEYFND